MKELDFNGLLGALTRICESGSPVALLIHTHPDGDAVGSAFALSALIGSAYPSCLTRVICADRLPARLRFIAGNVQDEIAAGFVPEKFSPAHCVAIALDVAAPVQLGALRDCYDVALTVDHHRCSTPFSDRFLDDGASATGEIVWRLAREWLRSGKITDIPPFLARAVYAAISSDTGCFKYSNVTPATHLAAAEIIEYVPDRADIDRLLFDTKTPERLAAEKAALEVLRTYSDGKIGICAMSQEEIAARGLGSEELDALIDVARSVAGVAVAFSVRGEGDGRYRVSARSNGRFDVSALCAGFGGGGHVRAAGCTVSAGSLEDAVETVIAAVVRTGV